MSRIMTCLLRCLSPTFNCNLLLLLGRQNAQQNASRTRPLGGPLPDMSDHEAMQRFFLQQVIFYIVR